MVRAMTDSTRSLPLYSEGGGRADLKVSDLPRALRPREKMLRDGPRALSHVELLAVILGSGTRKDGVLKIAERLIRRHGLGSFPGLSVREWATSPGVGQAGGCRIAALF